MQNGNLTETLSAFLKVRCCDPMTWVILTLSSCLPVLCWLNRSAR